MQSQGHRANILNSTTGSAAARGRDRRRVTTTPASSASAARRRRPRRRPRRRRRPRPPAPTPTPDADADAHAHAGPGAHPDAHACPGRHPHADAHAGPDGPPRHDRARLRPVHRHQHRACRLRADDRHDGHRQPAPGAARGPRRRPAHPDVDASAGTRATRSVVVACVRGCGSGATRSAGPSATRPATSASGPTGCTSGSASPEPARDANQGTVPAGADAATARFPVHAMHPDRTALAPGIRRGEHAPARALVARARCHRRHRGRWRSPGLHLRWRLAVGLVPRRRPLPLEGTAWQLTDYVGPEGATRSRCRRRSPRPRPSPRGKVAGNAGCNQYTAPTRSTATS